MVSSLTIVGISESDIPALLELCRLSHKECRYRSWPFSEEMAAEMLRRSLAPDAFGVKCVDVRNNIAGFYIGSITTMEFSPRPVGMQTLFWVKPQFRGTKAFYLLMKAFLRWCDSKQALPFIAPHFATDNSKTYRMLEKLGLKEFGKIYSKEK